MHMMVTRVMKKKNKKCINTKGSRSAHHPLPGGPFASTQMVIGLGRRTIYIYIDR